MKQRNMIDFTLLNELFRVHVHNDLVTLRGKEKVDVITLF